MSMMEAALVDMVIEILRKEGRPLKARELVERLNQEGRRVSKPQLNSALWRPTNRRAELRVDTQFHWSVIQTRREPNPQGFPHGVRQQLLLEYLKNRELLGQPFTIAEVAAKTRLAEASVRTYFSKKLLRRWVFPVGNFLFEACGIVSVGHAQFAAAMTQTSGAQLGLPFERAATASV
jgi:hypothetical protein